jgi:hypothetical protein
MGLLPIQKPTGNAAPEAAGEGAQPDPSKYVEEGEPNVSPEEQQQYEQFVNNALSLMYAENEVRPEIIEALSVQGQQQPEGPNPAVLALAQTAVTVVQRLDDSAREQGQIIPDDILMHGGQAVIEELAEIADAAKIYDYTPEEMTGALQQAIDIYRPKAIQDGRTNEETLKGQFAEINEADAAGKLGDVLPGLGQQTVGEPPVQAE